MPRKNKENFKPLTVEDFLKYKPKRLNFEWSINKEGFVEIKVSKFKSKIGISLCNVIRKENYFTANMDKIGSLVWKNCDGKKTVKEILDILNKEFSDENGIDQRLFLFIRQMKNLDYIDF